MSRRLKIPADANKIHPSFDADLGRINVILGANGSGKSQLLDKFKSQIKHQFPGASTVYVEGGRAIPPPDSLQLDNRSYSQHSTVAQSEASYQQKREKTLVSRIKDAFHLLDNMAQLVVREHSDAVEEWRRSNSKEPVPVRGSLPLDRLFNAFSEIFPDITLKFDPKTKSITCTKRGSTYSPSKLSDGEKQLLCLLADIPFLSDQKSIVVVDEPELNLNPTLACSAWDVIESLMPEATFVYSSHCLGFALRSGVEKVFVIEGANLQVREIVDTRTIERETLAPFLGAIPAILSTQTAIGVEGTERSFDAEFFKWIVSGRKIEVVPLGGCADVVAAVSRRGIWNHVAPTVKMVGVIDRDYRSETLLKELEVSAHVLVLPLHEVESFLCLPDVLHDLARKIGTAEKILTPDELASKIVGFCTPRVLQAAMRRAIGEFGATYHLQISRQAMAVADTEEKARSILQSHVATTNKNLQGGLDPAAVSKRFDVEFAACNSALAKKNIEKILALFSGKELLAHLAQYVGCDSPQSLLRGARSHLDPAAYPHISSFKTKVTTALQ